MCWHGQYRKSRDGSYHAMLLENRVRTFKDSFYLCLEGDECTLQSSLKYHLLYHVQEDLSTFGNLQMLNTSTFKYSQVIFKRNYKLKLKRKASSIYESVERYYQDIISRSNDT